MLLALDFFAMAQQEPNIKVRFPVLLCMSFDSVNLLVNFDASSSLILSNFESKGGNGCKGNPTSATAGGGGGYYGGGGGCVLLCMTCESS